MEMEKLARITKRNSELEKMSKSSLIEIIKQNHRVIDTKGMTKYLAVDIILQDEFGQKTMQEWYRKMGV